MSEEFFKRTTLTLGYHAMDICQIAAIDLNKKGSQVFLKAKVLVVIFAVDYVNLELSFQVIDPRQDIVCLFQGEAVA